MDRGGESRIDRAPSRCYHAAVEDNPPACYHLRGIAHVAGEREGAAPECAGLSGH